MSNLMSNNPTLTIVIGLVIVLIGCSFTYKFYLASIQGKCAYWTGFLPLTVISPWLIHIPNMSKRSLTKEAQGLWVHLLMGPIFLICAILCFAAGTEIMGLPGIQTLNWVLAGGSPTRAPAVAFDTRNGFRFPFLLRSKDTLGTRISKVKLFVKKGDEMLPDDQNGLGKTVEESRHH